MRNTYITAALIGVAIVLWLLSGGVGKKEEPTTHPSLAEINNASQARDDDRAPQRVRAKVINASRQTQHVELRGKTQSKRIVQVSTELAGRITQRPVERGNFVTAGTLLCQLSLDDRQASLTESREAVNQARIEYQGSLQLKAKGFQSDTAIAQAKARLAAAEANLTRSKLDMQRISVRAPFDGVVEDVHQELGDFVSRGDPCVTLVDMDPMLMVGRVAERNVHLMRLGQRVTGLLSDGRSITGPITFIGQQSDVATRTYPVEVQFPNAGRQVRSGITTQIQIPVAQVSAQKISPALFTLDDAGNLGIRTLNANNVVEFHEVAVVREDADGVWVSGLPEVATIITVGQELVVPGERVEPYFEASQDMPAAAPQPPPAADRDGPAAAMPPLSSSADGPANVAGG
jgi:multidrug efflux system membrane fusion protein